MIMLSSRQHRTIRSPATVITRLGLDESSDFRVKNKHQSSSNSTKSIGTSSLEEGGSSLVGNDLLEAVSSSTVNPLILGLLRLHLETTSDSVEGVRGVSGGNGGELGAGEFGCGTEESNLGFLVRIVTRKSIKETKVDSTVRNNTDDGNSNTVVKTSNTRRLDGLGETVHQTVKLLLSRTDIGSKTSTGIIERVNDHEGSSSGKTSRSHVDGEELEEFSVLVGLGEHGLDGVLEGKVEGLGREITDNVGQVSTPESLNSLLGSDASETVNNTGVSGNLSRDNLGVGILSLDKKLNTLNRGRSSLSDGSRDTTGQKVDDEIRHV
jgi:hypothetical protein